MKSAVSPTCRESAALLCFNVHSFGFHKQMTSSLPPSLKPSSHFYSKALIAPVRAEQSSTFSFNTLLISCVRIKCEDSLHVASRSPAQFETQRFYNCPHKHSPTSGSLLRHTPTQTHRVNFIEIMHSSTFLKQKVLTMNPEGKIISEPCVSSEYGGYTADAHTPVYLHTHL